MSLIRPLARLSILAVLASAWLLASNHCAIVALVGLNQSKHLCCKPESSAGDGKRCAEKCCKGLSAPVRIVDSVPSPFFFLVATLSEALDFTEDLAAFHFCGGLPPLERSPSFFVECVAGESQRSNAPPLSFI